jgi:type I restriction enzyme S subunit
MKHSGIEWLGEIPDHWNLTRLKRIIDEIFLGLTAKVDYVENEKEGVPLIRAGNLFGGKLDLTDLRYISHAQHEKLTKYRKVQKGDVLVTKSGSIGVCALLNKEGEFSLYESVFAIRPSVNKLSNKYLLLLLNSHLLKQQYTEGMVGMGVHHLNMSDMKNTIIPLPNIQEQENILSVLNNRLNDIDILHEKITKELKLLKEYKTALISEVVTGKVDVREEVLN